MAAAAAGAAAGAVAAAAAGAVAATAAGAAAGTVAAASAGAVENPPIMFRCLVWPICVNSRFCERSIEHSTCISRHVFHVPGRRCERHHDYLCAA